MNLNKAFIPIQEKIDSAIDKIKETSTTKFFIRSANDENVKVRSNGFYKKLQNFKRKETTVAKEESK